MTQKKKLHSRRRYLPRLIGRNFFAFLQNIELRKLDFVIVFPAATAGLLYLIILQDFLVWKG
jgi:hypothetical protein